jgi:hypothetical protein
LGPPGSFSGFKREEPGNEVEDHTALTGRHRIMKETEGPLSCATCPPIFMQNYAVYWPGGGAASQYSVFIGQKM